MDRLAIFCSYLKNLHRAARLFENISSTTLTSFLFYRNAEFTLLRIERVLSDATIHWLNQEEVFAAFPSARTAKYENVPGGHRCSKSFSQKHGDLELQKTCWSWILIANSITHFRRAISLRRTALLILCCAVPNMYVNSPHDSIHRRFGPIGLK